MDEVKDKKSSKKLVTSKKFLESEEDNIKEEAHPLSSESK